MTANTLAICVATMTRPDENPDIAAVYPDVYSWDVHAFKKPDIHFWFNDRENLGVVGAYQKLYERHTEDVLLFLHDDVICREQDWDLRLMAEFIADEQVALLGFGGALWHGLPDLYKVPYQLQQLQRGDYRSNVDDAEVHGQRFKVSCNVAVLDGFALAVRRSFLDRIGGFSQVLKLGIDFINYDYTICALARRYSYKIRMIGVRCHHRGGVTSTKLGIDWQPSYIRAHRVFYDHFRDVMPCKVSP